MVGREMMNREPLIHLRARSTSRGRFHTRVRVSFILEHKFHSSRCARRRWGRDPPEERLSVNQVHEIILAHFPAISRKFRAPCWRWCRARCGSDAALHIRIPLESSSAFHDDHRLQLIRHHRNRSVAEQSRAELLIQSPPPSLLHCSRICCCCCCWGLGYGNLRGSLPVPLLSSVAFIRSCTSLHCQERCLWLPVPAESRQTAAHVATNGQLVRRTHELLRSSWDWWDLEAYVCFNAHFDVAP